MAVMVGGALTAFTVSTKLVDAFNAPSLTAMVMVDVPLSPAAGVTTTVRSAPVPPRSEERRVGKSGAFDDVAESVNPLGGVSASPMVKAMGDVGVFSFVD